MPPNELIKVNFKITRNGLTVAVFDRFTEDQLREALNGSSSDQLEIITNIKALTKKKIWYTLPDETKRKLSNNWAGFIDWAEVRPFIVKALKRCLDLSVEMKAVPSQRVINLTEQESYPR